MDAVESCVFVDATLTIPSATRGVRNILRLAVSWRHPAPELFVRLYRPHPDPALCAGCGNLLSGSDVLTLPDSVRVHVDDEWSCLRTYGKRWRAEATKALAVMGVLAPDDAGEV